MNNNAGMLHRTARTVLHAAEDNPPPWWGEFAAWVVPLIGKQPEEKLGTRAHENWNLVALGALLAWGYFSEMLGEAVAGMPETDSNEGNSDSGVGSSSPGLGDAVGNAEGGNLVLPPKEAFAVLGPDGQPLIEGYK